LRKVSINGKHVDRRDLMGDTRAVSIERVSQDIEVGEGNYKGGSNWSAFQVLRCSTVLSLVFIVSRNL
jgi:hypothetical protein